ncbi:gamma carbonic anhydrase family protein [Marinibaculum pumilum]|uniref:Gamma carbonic anhydrase family protein n=1 Tax=Marinibaculum pumilum TaxID=1766165 RepID=A0ABV7KWJ1_9PROT
MSDTGRAKADRAGAGRLGAALIHPYRGTWPRIDPAAFVAPGAVVAGDVEIGPGCSIWYNCTLRGDVNVIRIGRDSNIQDGTVIHVSRFGQGTYIGDSVTVGHMALLHACMLRNGCFIGMQATVMDDCVVEAGAMVAAGALVTPGKTVPQGTVWGGRPAKYMRDIRPDEVAYFADTARHYAAMGAEYAAALKAESV